MFVRVDAVLGNLRDFPIGARAVERIDVGSDAMTRRVLRLPSSAGDLGIRLRDDRRIADGDVVFADDRRVIAVSVRAEPVLVAAPRSIAEAVDVAHALGNRHIPIQRNGQTIVVAYTDALETLFATLGVPFERRSDALARPFVHAFAPHGHE